MSTATDTEKPVGSWGELDAGNPGRQSQWQSVKTIDALLSRRELGPVPGTLAIPCWERLQNIRKELHGSWKGCDFIIDWLLAAFIARENVLLIGPPGGAKSEIVTRLYSLLGLATPKADMDLVRQSLAERTDLLTWWEDRERLERRFPKQFHYLLQRFVQPEELFGPIEIDLLKRGVLVRVNFGMLTGPGVFAAFLDEIFTASPNLLNVLLTLLAERKYFNWGGMVPGDLVFLAAASNELPGASEVRSDEFRSSYALLDRLTARLRVDIPSATSVTGARGVGGSDLAEATRLALVREGNRFATGIPFAQPTQAMASLSDMLCLGRFLFQHLSVGSDDAGLFVDKTLSAFESGFYSLATYLQREATRVRDFHVTWTISPRKLKALYKLGLAHALIRIGDFNASQSRIALGPEDLLAFTLIWDSVEQQDRLEKAVRGQLRLES